MRPDERDAAYLWDMQEACRAIVSFVAGRTLESYLAAVPQLWVTLGGQRLSV